MDIEHEIAEHDKRIAACEECDKDLLGKVNKLVGSADVTLLLLKFVITPLIIILGALVGVKIAM